VQCPSCKAEVPEREFCASCLSRIAEPSRKGEALEAALAEKEVADVARKRVELHRAGRQFILYGGAVLLAVTMGIAVAAIVGAYSGGGAPSTVREQREPRVRCGRDQDCGRDACSRLVRCLDHVCTREMSPCPEAGADPFR
jgi:hypothetical protein